MNLLAACAIGFVLSAAQVGVPPVEELTGLEVLARMRAVYALSDSYSDTCNFTVSVASASKPLALWSHGVVSMRYVRGSALRVEASFAIGSDVPVPSYVLHSSGGVHRVASFSTERSEPHVAEYGSLEYAVAATTGSTGLMAAPAQYVGSLLLGSEFSQLGLGQLVNPVAEAIEPLGEHLCVRIRAEGVGGTVVTLWVDRHSWLLRRLTRDDAVGDMHRVTTLELYGVVNPSISPSELSYP